MRRTGMAPLVVAALATCLIGVAPAGAAVITVVNNDGAGEGFNDPTPVSAVGGNPCGTLGAQRLRALQFAADLWADRLASNVEIRIAATWDPLPCGSGGAVLAQAGPATARRDFTGAPVAGTWYPIPLANALHGSDLDPGVDDINAFFNSDIDAGCLGSTVYYYGLDANPPGNDVDLVAVALHEFGHGMGFLTLVDTSTGAKALGFDDAFMRNLEDHTSGLLWPAMTDGQRAASATNTGNLHWVGADVVAAGTILTAGTVGGHVRMYAPSALSGGSSVSHWDTVCTPDEVLEPIYTSAFHDPSLAYHAMIDEGWPVVAPNCGDGVVQAAEGCDDGDTTDGDGCSHRCTVEQCYTCVGLGPSICTPVLDGTGCDDGNQCTLTDACQAGVCTGASPVDCSSGDPCIAAGACDTCNGTCAPGLPTCLDDFLCYTAKTSLGQSKFVPQLGVTLDDVYEAPITVDVSALKHLCTPADVGGGLIDPNTHLTVYRNKPETGTPKFTPQLNVQVDNTIGRIFVDVSRRDLLLVPAAEDPSTDPTPPVFGSHEVDHYKCYKVKITRGAPKFPKGIQVTADDHFPQAAKTLDVKKPKLLCTPVDVNGSTIKHTAVRQLCYQVKPALGQPKHVPQLDLHTADRFGTLQVDTKKEDLLCVPSITTP